MEAMHSKGAQTYADNADRATGSHLSLASPVVFFCLNAPLLSRHRGAVIQDAVRTVAWLVSSEMGTG
jgi:hypothetical protein